MTAKAISWGLIAISLLLAVWLMTPYSDDNWTDVGTQMMSEEDAQHTVSLQDSPTDINTYSSITSRPLFNSDRKPVANAKKEVLATTENVPKSQPVIIPSVPSLVGVMTVSNVEMAFVMGKGDTAISGLKIDDSYKGWILMEIKPTQIIMAYNGLEETIGLDWTLKEMLHNSEEQSEQAQPSPMQSVQVQNKQVEPDRALNNLKDRLSRHLELNP